MASIPERVRAAIEAGRLAHLVALNADGRPRVTGVWVGIEGDTLVTAHLGAWQKVKHARHDRRVVLSLETDQKNAVGLTQYLVIYGHAEVEEGGAPEQLQRLAHT